MQDLKNVIMRLETKDWQDKAIGRTTMVSMDEDVSVYIHCQTNRNVT